MSLLLIGAPTTRSGLSKPSAHAVFQSGDNFGSLAPLLQDKTCEGEEIVANRGKQ